MTVDERIALAKLNYVVALGRYRDDDWQVILAAIPQDAAAVAASGRCARPHCWTRPHTEADHETTGPA